MTEHGLQAGLRALYERHYGPLRVGGFVYRTCADDAACADPAHLAVDGGKDLSRCRKGLHARTPENLSGPPEKRECRPCRAARKRADRHRRTEERMGWAPGTWRSQGNLPRATCLRGGHALAGDNLYVDARGARRCVTCRAETDARAEARRVAAGLRRRGASGTPRVPRETCMSGRHRLDEPNVYRDKLGRRTCRTCRAEHAHARYVARRAARRAAWAATRVAA